MTALNAPFTRISQPHASGKKSHVTQTLLIPICRMLPQVNKAEMKVKNHNLSKTTKNAISLRMAMNIQWWTLLCSPANPNEFIILELLWVWNLHIRKYLEVVVQAKDPSMVFLVEAWEDEAGLKENKCNLEFENLFFVKKE